MFRLIKLLWEQIYYIRYFLILIIVFTSTVAFMGTSLVNGDTHWEIFFGSLYTSISLFLFGGLDAGFPAGEPLWTRVILYFNYFFAPFLTAGVSIKLIYSSVFKYRSPRFRGHDIVCGLGRNGALIFELLKKTNNRIVLIEQDAANPLGAEISRNPKIWWIQQDFREKPVLEQAHLHAAKRVYLTTNHDLTNLNAMLEMKQMLVGKEQNVEFYCQIGDHDLEHNMEKVLLPEDLMGHVHFFNAYRMVTHRLYDNYLKKRNMLADGGNLFVLLGFGRFGQLMYYRLVKRDMERTGQDEIFVATHQKSPILDRLQYRWSNAKYPAHCKIHKPVYGDVCSPEVWDQVDKLAQECQKPLIVFIGMDNDIANINTAISMKLQGPETLKKATIICRIYSPAAKMLQDVLEKHLTPNLHQDVILFPMKKELQAALQDDLFSPNEQSA